MFKTILSSNINPKSSIIAYVALYFLSPSTFLWYHLLSLPQLPINCIPSNLANLVSHLFSTVITHTYHTKVWSYLEVLSFLPRWSFLYILSWLHSLFLPPSLCSHVISLRPFSHRTNTYISLIHTHTHTHYRPSLMLFIFLHSTDPQLPNSLYSCLFIVHFTPTKA